MTSTESKDFASKELNFPLYLYGENNENVYAILNYLTHNVVFEDGKGYIDPETSEIRIFKRSPQKHTKIPCFWYENGLIKFNSVSEKTRDHFNAKNLSDYSYDIIVKSTKEGEELYDEKAIADMNDAASVYHPIINEDDDFLKIAVKTTIQMKGIDINRLKCKLDTKYGLTNLKAALIGKTRMSVANFTTWMELLGCDFDLIIRDDGRDHIDPLRKEIKYSNVTNKAE